jgi:hypothetical protein
MLGLKTGTDSWVTLTFHWPKQVTEPSPKAKSNTLLLL